MCISFWLIGLWVMLNGFVILFLMLSLDFCLLNLFESYFCNCLWMVYFLLFWEMDYIILVINFCLNFVI